MKTSLLLVSLLCAGLVQAQGAYRWLDQDGKVHYSDRPPAAASGKAKELRLGAPAADKQASFTMRQAMENFPVTLYVSADCGEACKEAGAYLKKRDIPFTEKIVTSAEDSTALAKLIGGQAVVPVLTVGTKNRKGFEQGSWDGLLDAAGYPKAAN
jgi:glutaredoxin